MYLIFISIFKQNVIFKYSMLSSVVKATCRLLSTFFLSKVYTLSIFKASTLLLSREIYEYKLKC